MVKRGGDQNSKHLAPSLGCNSNKPYLLPGVITHDVQPESVGGRRGGEGAHAQRRAVVRRAVGAVARAWEAGRPMLPPGGVACCYGSTYTE